MPRYRIYRVKETAGESFRWVAHTSGLANVKPKDYETSGEVEAKSSYAAWNQLFFQDDALRCGDLLETVNPGGSPSELQIFKYIGFEPAQWHIPEAKGEDASSVAVSSPSSESVASN